MNEKITMMVSLPKDVYKDLLVICHITKEDPCAYIVECVKASNKKWLGDIKMFLGDEGGRLYAENKNH